MRKRPKIKYLNDYSARANETNNNYQNFIQITILWDIRIFVTLICVLSIFPKLMNAQSPSNETQDISFANFTTILLPYRNTFTFTPNNTSYILQIPHFRANQLLYVRAVVQPPAHPQDVSIRVSDQGATCGLDSTIITQDQYMPEEISGTFVSLTGDPIFICLESNIQRTFTVVVEMKIIGKYIEMQAGDTVKGTAEEADRYLIRGIAIDKPVEIRLTLEPVDSTAQFFYSFNWVPTRSDYEGTSSKGTRDLTSDTRTYKVSPHGTGDLYILIIFDRQAEYELFIGEPFPSWAIAVIVLVTVSVIGVTCVVVAKLTHSFEFFPNSQTYYSTNFFSSYVFFFPFALIFFGAFVGIGASQMETLSSVGISFLVIGCAIFSIFMMLTGHTTYEIDLEKDIFIITKRYFIVIPSRTFIPLMQIKGFSLKETKGKRGNTLSEMRFSTIEGKETILEPGVNHLYLKRKQDFIEQANKLLAEKGKNKNSVESKDKSTEDRKEKLTHLRNLSITELGEYLTKHPQDASLVSDLMKERTL